MKTLILLVLVPFFAHAKVPPLSCEEQPIDLSKNNPEQIQSYYCELNLRCTVNALNKASINWDDVDGRREYSLKNHCNDELKLAALMADMAKDPPELHAAAAPQINQSERTAGKDLPVIPAAPAEKGASVQEE